jgi:hypothetical protein
LPHQALSARAHEQQYDADVRVIVVTDGDLDHRLEAQRAAVAFERANYMKALSSFDNRLP